MSEEEEGRGVKAKKERSKWGAVAGSGFKAAGRAKTGFAKLLRLVQHKQDEHNAGSGRDRATFSVDYALLALLSSPVAGQTFADAEGKAGGGCEPRAAGGQQPGAPLKRKAVMFLPAHSGAGVQDFAKLASRASRRPLGTREADTCDAFKDDEWETSVVRGTGGIDAWEKTAATPTQKRLQVRRVGPTLPVVWVLGAGRKLGLVGWWVGVCSSGIFNQGGWWVLVFCVLGFRSKLGYHSWVSFAPFLFIW
jgi:hypothetical protein